MPILGIGTDIIEIERIQQAATPHFLQKYFSEEERILFGENKLRFQVIAGNFAAKEAVVKALGTGFSSGIEAAQIEILRHQSGKPYVRLSGCAMDRLSKVGGGAIEVSISHCKAYAVAFVIIQSETANTNEKE